jgi:hypothetical protein
MGESADHFSDAVDLRPLLEEPDARITVTRHELLGLVIEADEALDGTSSVRGTLASIRESLSELLEDPERRYQ